MQFRRKFIGVLLAGLLPLAGHAGGGGFTLTSDVPSGQSVGTTVNWNVAGTGIGLVDTRLSVRRVSAGEAAVIMYDYSQRRDFDWAPMKQGAYLITAQVRDAGDGSLTNLSQIFRIFPVPGSAQTPLVSPTMHPLVALYSAPQCTAGLSMRVTFRRATPGARLYKTNAKPCVTGETMNFQVAGMTELSTYQIRHNLETQLGVVVGTGPVRQFTTGAIDTLVAQPTVTVPAGVNTSTAESIVLSGPTPGQGVGMTAANLEGEIVWYYRGSDNGDVALNRWTDGGTVFSIGPSDPMDRFTLREADLIGNTVRETTSRRISEQLSARGEQIISVVHHEAMRLPNGHIVTLGSNERLLEDVQGEGVVDVIGDVVIVMDENLQVVWTTNFFNILDVTRLATGDEKCVSGGPGCPIVFLIPEGEEANDWTHSNSVTYSPTDGNLIISMRHQDWVIKVDYRDGAGTGALVWRFGKGGDFTALGFPVGTDPWQSHQHDAAYYNNNQITIYDNGNMNDACLANPDDCTSRGQAWTLDELNMTATLDTNADLFNYSFAVGASQAMANGNYHYNSGFPEGPAAPLSRQQEVMPDGTIVYEIDWNARAYRGYRLRDMYTSPLFPAERQTN